MGRGRDGTRIPTDGASRQGHGTNLGDLLRARGLVPADIRDSHQLSAGENRDSHQLSAGDAPPDPDSAAVRRETRPGNTGSAPAVDEAGKAPAFPARVVLRRERKGRGGRTVTRVQGLGWDDAALAELARAMARALGCGATIEDGDVVLQGDPGERAAAWLEERGVRRVVR